MLFKRHFTNKILFDIILGEFQLQLFNKIFGKFEHARCFKKDEDWNDGNDYHTNYLYVKSKLIHKFKLSIFFLTSQLIPQKNLARTTTVNKKKKT